MKTLTHALAQLLLLIIIPLGWQCFAINLPGSPGYYFFFSFSCLVGAVVLFSLQFLFDKHTPSLSLRTFQASISLSILGIVIPFTLNSYAAKTFSPFYLGTTILLAPLFLKIWGNNVKSGLSTFLVSLMFGIFAILSFNAAYFFKMEGTHYLFTAFFFLVPITFSLAITLIRKQFWIHSATSLTIGSYVFGALFFGAWGVLNKDYQFPLANYPWKWILIQGAIVQGVGCYLYEAFAFTTKKSFSLAFCALVPLVGFAYEYFYLQSLSASHLGLVGLVLLISALLLFGVFEVPGVFLCHYLGNTRRKGERVACQLPGFIKFDRGNTLEVEVRNISIGGVGFKSSQLLAIADKVLLTIPLGKTWTQVTMDAQIVFVEKIEKDGKIFYMVGARFENIDEEIQPTLIEFIAQVGNLSLRESYGRTRLVA